MKPFQYVVIFFICLLQLSNIHSLLEPEKSQGNDSIPSEYPEKSKEVEYERKYSVGEVIIPPGLISTDYYNFDRPPGPRNINGTTPGYVSFTIYSLPDFNEDKEELSIEWQLRIIWWDDRFDHFASKLNDDEFVVLDVRIIDRIWHPHIYVDGLKSNIQASVMGTAGKLTFSATQQKTARVYFDARSTIVSNCDTDYTYYPFDVVVCPVVFWSYLYNIRELVLEAGGVVFKDLDVPGFTVSMTDLKQQVYERDYDTSSSLVFKILLKRDPTSNVIQVYIPSLVFVVICFASFTLRQASDRIACSTLSLLSLFVILGNMGSTPQGPFVTYLHKWVLMCIIVVFLPLLETFISLKLHSLAQSAEEETKQLKPEGVVDAEVSAAQAQAKEQRLQELKKITRIVEKMTPVVVLIAFSILNIIYWSFLLQGSNEAFNQQSTTT